MRATCIAMIRASQARDRTAIQPLGTTLECPLS